MPFAEIAAAAALGINAGNAFGLFGGGSSSPSVPGLSPQEQALLQSQGVSLRQFQNILRNEANLANQFQGLLGNISGLFSEEEFDGGFNFGPANDFTELNDIITRGRRQGLADIELADQLGLSEQDFVRVNDLVSTANRQTQELERFRRQGDVGGQQRASRAAADAVRQIQNFRVKGTRRVVNPDALEDLRGRVQEAIEFEDKFREESKELGERFGSTLEAQLDRLDRALKGELPVSEGTLKQKQDMFERLRNELGRTGDRVSGDTLESAVAETTRGNQLLAELKTQFRAVEEAERRGEISPGFANFGQGLGFRSGLAGQSAAPPTQLGFIPQIQGVGPSRLLPGFAQSAASLGLATQPFQQQRLLEFQGALQNAANRNQRRNDQISFGTNLASLGFFFGGLPGRAPTSIPGNAPGGQFFGPGGIFNLPGG